MARGDLAAPRRTRQARCARGDREQEGAEACPRDHGPILEESEPKLVRAPCHAAIEELEEVEPKAARILEDAEVDALAYLSLPKPHQTRIRTNNVQERMNLEPRRRTKVVQAFPSPESVLRLLGGIIDETDADWETSRVFISPESLKPVLGLEMAENRFDEFEPDEEAMAKAQAIMMVALDEYRKAA